MIDSTPTRLLLDDEDDNNTGGGGGGGGGGIYGDRHREDHQTGSSDSRRGSRHKEFGGGKSGGDLSGHHHTSRRQNLNRYQAEKGFGGNNGGNNGDSRNSGNGGSNSDMGGYESAPEGRRVRLKHRTTSYGGIIVDDDDDEEKEEVGERGGINDDDALSSSTDHYKQQQSVDSSQTVAGAGENGGNKGHYHHPKMASNPLLRNDGLPGYPGPPGFDPAVYFDEKQTSNGPPCVEYSAPSAGFLLFSSASSSSDPASATVYDENGLEHLTQNHLNSHHQEKAAYSDVKTSSSSLSHQKMARDRGDHHPHHPHHPHHHQPGGGPAVAVVAPPPQSTPAMNSHEPLPVAFPKAGGSSHLAGIEKRHKGGVGSAAVVVGLPKSSVLPHHHHPHHHLMMSPVAGAGATSPQVTSHQDIYRMLSTAAVAAAGNGPIPGPLVPSGYEAASK